MATPLSQPVAVALRCPRGSLAAIGRPLLGHTKHQIKKTWRFRANQRVETAAAMSGLRPQGLTRRKKPLLVRMDGTDSRGVHPLVAAAAIRGQADAAVLGQLLQARPRRPQEPQRT